MRVVRRKPRRSAANFAPRIFRGMIQLSSGRNRACMNCVDHSIADEQKMGWRTLPHDSRQPYPQTLALFLFGRASARRGSRFDLRNSLLFLLYLGRCALRIITTQVKRKLTSVVRVDLRVVLAARDRNIRKTVVNQQFAFVGVHVDQNAFGGMPLAAVASDGINVVEMRMFADIESNLTT